MSKLKTVWDAVIYYGGSNFVNGNHEQYHTHVISIHNTEKIGTAYASDIGMNAIICGIKTYNQCIDDMSTNYGRSSLKHLAIWQAGLKESKEALDSIVKKPLVYTQEMADNGELPSVGMECLIYNAELMNPEYEKATIDFVGCHVIVYSSESCTERTCNLELVRFKPIDTRTKKEKAIDELRDFDNSICNDTEWYANFLQAIIDGKITGVKWVGE